MDNLDIKIKNVFPEESVYKIPKRYNIFNGKNLPSFIKDWLMKKFTDDFGELDSESLLNFLESHIPQKDNAIKNRLRTHREEVTILTRFVVETDIQHNKLKFSIPDLGIKSNEGRIPDYIAKKHSDLKDGEIWGVITLAYIPPDGKEKGFIELVNYKPFKPYSVDLDYFKSARKEFSTEEWIDVLLKSMEYNPKGFKSLQQKLQFLSRLLIFVEPRLNLIELAPKGTGKSYIFSNLSKYGWLISGGVVTRAKLFYDIQKRTYGIIKMYDFVAMDEIQTIKFSEPDELKGALKSYLESGICTVANVKIDSSAGMILLGNIPLSNNKLPLNRNYFASLPEFFKESALLDRFHGFIEGWQLPRIKEDLKANGYTLNVEYFSEILHSLREDSSYNAIVSELLDIPKNADTRDTTAIIKLTTAYLKLLFPHIESVNEINKEEFRNFCLNMAITKRAIIREQIHLIDDEFEKELPNIDIK
jgi:ATP-dependent Lon protease